jgi:glutamyl-tRNA reductase
MKKSPDESMEQWASRVEKYEYGRALMQIAEGKPLDQIMEDMSRRMVAKLMHPIIDAIKENSSNEWTEKEAKESAQRYKENYIDKFSTKADHIDNDT